MANYKRNKFNGADDIWLTNKNNIAVKRVSTYVDKKGIYHHHEKTRYYLNTPKNLMQAKKVFGRISKK